MAWIGDLVDPVMANIIGGSAGSGLLIGTLFFITILVVLLLAARIPIGLAMVIVSPAVIVASFSGLLPPLAFGVMVVLVAVFFAGILLSLAR